MAQKKRTGKKGKKPSAKKSSKTSVSPSTRKATKARVKGKATGSGKKKKAASAKKITVKKPTAKKTKPAKVQKSTANKVKKMKAVASSSGKPRKAGGTPGSPKASTRTSSSELTVIERYNVGGLFACAIERTSDPEFKRLRSVLRELDLSSMEKDNLIRLSQGFTIPKLFADGVGEHKVGQTLANLITFALAEGGYEKKWRDEIRQVGMWLGFFPQQVEQIEQKILAKQ